MMDKTSILNDKKFRLSCANYGLDWNNFQVYNDVILVYTPVENLYVMFDKNYNVIGVEKNDSMKEESVFVEDFYERYSIFADILPFGLDFSYPFGKYTLKDFIDLSSRIDIVETNHGHSLRTKINEQWFDRSEAENIEYFELISYIKFIGERIQQYFLINYQMQMVGLKTIDVYSYVRQLMSTINNFVGYSVQNDLKIPYPCDVLCRLGLPNDSDVDFLLYDVISLLMKKNGFKESSGSLMPILESERKDLSLLANNLLNLLSVPDYVLKLAEKSNDGKIKPIESLLMIIEKKDFVMTKKQ